MLIGYYLVIKIEKKYIGGHIRGFIYKQVSVTAVNNKLVLCNKENIPVSIPPKFIHWSDHCMYQEETWTVECSIFYTAWSKYSLMCSSWGVIWVKADSVLFFNFSFSSCHPLGSGGDYWSTDQKTYV